jgi:RNA polymerase sigma factor for flagellar operon FliA
MPLSRLENILIGVDLKEGYTSLTKREKNIINLYYLEGYKDDEIAVFYDLTRQLTRQAINYIRNKGINKLKIF